MRPSGLGQRLPEAVQRKMEAFFGASFADVRVHVGSEAPSIGALAFTIGSDLYFAPGQYNPQTMQGQQLLGHELTHVVQQRAGRVKNPMGGGLAVVQDPHLEAEAERMGMRAASSSVPIQAKAAGASPGGPGPVVAPILPGTAAAAPPVRPAAIGPAPIRPRPAAGLSPLQARPAGAPATAPVQVAPPAKVGPNTYRIAAGAGGRPIGSVLVHARGASAIEVTDLSVDPSHRGQGLGGILMASAMRAGQQLGRSRVVLASQDDGSGRLTRWYRRMGFEPGGVNALGYPKLEAPIGRVLASVAQARMAATTATRAEIVQPRTDGPIRLAGPGTAIRPAGPVLQRGLPPICPRNALVRVPGGLSGPRVLQRKARRHARRLSAGAIAGFAPGRAGHRPGVVQRAEMDVEEDSGSGSVEEVLDADDLEEIARSLNRAQTGNPESRNTQAVVRTTDGELVVFTQREYSAFDGAIEAAEEEYGVTIDERVIGDNRNDEGIHAEMLAISWWLQDHIEKPESIGVSQGICARCQAVLDYYGIDGSPAGGQTTANWVHPMRHADMVPTVEALKALPQKVTRGREYPWPDDEEDGE